MLQGCWQCNGAGNIFLAHLVPTVYHFKTPSYRIFTECPSFYDHGAQISWWPLTVRCCCTSRCSNLSQTDFLNMTVTSLYSNGLQCHQTRFCMQLNRRLLATVLHSCQHRPKHEECLKHLLDAIKKAKLCSNPVQAKCNYRRWTASASLILNYF